MSDGNCVETPDAPEWLSKLENRREQLKRTRLGHETGAGAPCNVPECTCPGLDLHFWRKVCRNCKCRKDQHICNDDEMTGWAQFEILGQIRAKPAYIKIKAFSQPVQLEWLPNAAPDVVSDYMEKMGTAQIPIAGSDAAKIRKQQLEFQVPPHDLDAALCDSLTDTEAQQLQQYVQKLREQCVGQGTVVRVGQVNHARLEHVKPPNADYAMQTMQLLGLPPVSDATLVELLSNPKLRQALVGQQQSPTQAKLLVAFAQPLSDSSLEFTALQPQIKQKLLGLNPTALQSLISHGVIYDKLLGMLEDKQLNITRDPTLGVIAEFRKEYNSNPEFRAAISTIYAPQPSTPIKMGTGTLFHSPLPLKQPLQARFGTQMRQDTPMRRVKFGGVTTVLYDCGLPVNIDYEKDPVFAQIVNAEPLKQALQATRLGSVPQPLIIAPLPAASANLKQLKGLSPALEKHLQNAGVDRHMLHSAVANTPYYERLFQALQEKNIKHDNCQLLQPLKNLHDWLLNDEQLLEDIDKVFADMANAAAVGDIAYADLTSSQSNDSGFHSKPTTPGYGNDAASGGPEADNNLAAGLGKFMSIPGIEDMNMYPNCASMPEQFQQLQITNKDKKADVLCSLPAINCRDCGLPISMGEVAVKAERAGKEIAWHPACFKCHTCRELLADLVYFFHHGQIYCGRDLAIKLKIPRCKACDELIFTKEYTAAEGATFHIKHFCCFQCDTPLAGQEYVPDEKSNMPLCLQCYDKFFARACKRCQMIIGPTDQGVAWGDIHWHGQCFMCAGANCAKSLIGGRFCVKQDMPFCSPACVRSIIQ